MMGRLSRIAANTTVAQEVVPNLTERHTLSKKSSPELAIARGACCFVVANLSCGEIQQNWLPALRGQGREDGSNTSGRLHRTKRLYKVFCWP